MDLKLLEYINAIVEEGNLSRAAEKLYISQSALSQQLKKLRNEGLPPLFEERKHRMELTDAGKIYLNGARAILRIERLAREEIAGLEMSPLSGVRIAVSECVFLPFSTFILPKLRKLMPSAEITVLPYDISSVRPLLRDGELDLAILPDIISQKDTFYYETLYQDELVLAAREDTDPDTMPVVLPPKTSALRRLCDLSFSLQGKYPEVYLETSNLNTALSLVRSGLASAVLPKSETDDPQIKTVSFSKKGMFNIVCMYSPERRSSAAKTVPELWRSTFRDGDRHRYGNVKDL